MTMRSTVIILAILSSFCYSGNARSIRELAAFVATDKNIPSVRRNIPTEPRRQQPILFSSHKNRGSYEKLKQKRFVFGRASQSSRRAGQEEDGLETISEQPRSSTNSDEEGTSETGRRKIRSRVSGLAKSLVSRPLSLATTVPMPNAIGAILKEASLAAVEQVVEGRSQVNADNLTTQEFESSKEMMASIIEEAFAPAEESLDAMEKYLAEARLALKNAKSQSIEAVEAIRVAAISQAEGAAVAVAEAEKVAERKVMAEIYSNAVSDVDVENLSFDDVDYESSEMAPPFLDPDSCLVPGEPIVRVERAPENSRRIFAGIDIMASVDDVWNVSVVPVQLKANLCVNCGIFFRLASEINSHDKNCPRPM